MEASHSRTSATSTCEDRPVRLLVAIARVLRRQELDGAVSLLSTVENARAAAEFGSNQSHVATVSFPDDTAMHEFARHHHVAAR